MELLARKSRKLAFHISRDLNYWNVGFYFYFSETLKYQIIFFLSMIKENKDEQIGFHKGALTTLAKEREEMLKILSIVEQLMQMHIKGLKDLGVDLQKESKPKKIEDSLR